jgi:hypothetical protein
VDSGTNCAEQAKTIEIGDPECNSRGKLNPDGGGTCTCFDATVYAGAQCQYTLVQGISYQGGNAEDPK